MDVLISPKISRKNRRNIRIQYTWLDDIVVVTGGIMHNYEEKMFDELLKSCVVVSFRCFITDIRSLRF